MKYWIFRSIDNSEFGIVVYVNIREGLTIANMKDIKQFGGTKDLDDFDLPSKEYCKKYLKNIVEFFRYWIISYHITDTTLDIETYSHHKFKYWIVTENTLTVELVKLRLKMAAQ